MAVGAAARGGWRRRHGTGGWAGVAAITGRLARRQSQAAWHWTATTADWHGGNHGAGTADTGTDWHGWHGGRYYYPGWAFGLGVGIGLTYPWWGWGYP